MYNYFNPLITTIVFFIIAGCNSTLNHTIIRDGGELWGHDGKYVVAEGSVAREIWQHIIAPPRDHPHATYFDLGKQQTVIYSKEPVACSGAVRIEGRVLEIEGSSKDPRRKETCTEYHIVVDNWKCLN